MKKSRVYRAISGEDTACSRGKFNQRKIPLLLLAVQDEDFSDANDDIRIN